MAEIDYRLCVTEKSLQLFTVLLMSLATPLLILLISAFTMHVLLGEKLPAKSMFFLMI